MQALAQLSREMGDGELRLTVWQNLLVSGVDATSYEAFEARLQAIGLTSRATNLRAGLIACTGAPNCKFGAANTKGTAEALAAYIEPRLTLDTPINIHLTGCHHSCAQHYIGDIGMIACKVPVPGSEDVTDGFHILAGGGFGSDAVIASDLFTAVRVEDCPALVLSILQTYGAYRTSEQETFAEFSRRLGAEQLKNLVLTQEACE